MKRYAKDFHDKSQYVKQNLWPEGKMPYKQDHQCVPYLEWYVPEKLTSKSIQIIYSGGSYQGNAPDGFEVAPFRRYLNEKGMTVVTMRYRTPRPKGLAKHTSAWADLQRCIRIVRAEAPKRGLDPNKIGIMGSSAGGHLASTAATHFTEETRPDFQILFYPVVTMTDYTHQGSKDNLLGKNPSEELVKLYSNELQVNENTPPAFIMHSSDDTVVPVLNSINYYLAMCKHGVPASMHFYPVGGHGWGYNETFPYKSQWKAEMEKWLREIHK